jgi:predicted ATPase/transcriptional regulator with XRE-family HTH domain
VRVRNNPSPALRLLWMRVHFRLSTLARRMSQDHAGNPRNCPRIANGGRGVRPDDPKPFASELRRLRRRAGLTQEELAERAGLSVRGISDLERGANRTARGDTARRLAAALAIEGQERTRFLAVARGRAVAPAAGIRALPTPPTPLIGRKTEMAALLTLLDEPTCRLITLTGVGGTGKTRLALEVAHSAADRIPDGVAFADLAPLADPALVGAEIAETLGLGERAGRTRPEALAEVLAEKRVLLILDNFEHLLGAAPLVADLLSRCPLLTVLVTSRTPLRLRGERVYAVPPLPLPSVSPTGAVSSELLLENEAVTLFVERASAATADFAVTADDVVAAVEICRRLDGLPLAIELAAARVPLLSPVAIASRLENRLELLTRGARDLPARHRTLHNAIDWSYQLLDREEQWLFRRLGVFAGGATLAAVSAVCGTPADAVAIVDRAAALVGWGLVRRETQPDGEPRLRMLETLREFALARLVEEGEAEAAQRAHAEYFLDLAERAEPELTGPAQAAWLARLDAEQDNLRGALTWTLRERNERASLRLAGALWWNWEIRGQYAEGQSWLERALIVADRRDTRGLAKALFGLGALAYRQRDLERSENCLTEALELYRALADPVGRAWCLSFLGLGMLVRGQFARAEALHNEALAAAREAGDTLIESGALSNLGEVAHVRGDLVRAERLYEASLSVGETIANPLVMVRSRTNLATLAAENGRWRQSRSLHRDALRVYVANGDRRGIASSLEGLAVADVFLGRLTHATRLLAAAAALRMAVGSPVPAVEQRMWERGMATARSRLGQDAFDQAWNEGFNEDLDAAIAMALNPPAASSPAPPPS